MNPDPSFLWLGKNHEKAFSILQKGISHSNGLLLLAGGAGTGKTLLVKAFIQSLGKGAEGAEGDIEYAAIWDPRLERIDFYNAIARGFGIKTVFTSKVEFLLQFSHFLHEAADKNKRVLLLVDDCHLLSQEILEELRLLSNIEKAGAKLINVFFVGRPEFDDMLLQQKNRALRQRLTLSAELKSLTIEETDNYIRHRLKIAGTEAPLFVAEAVQIIHRFSQGIPLHINAICDHVLENGSIQGMHTIESKLVEQTIQRMDLPEGLLHEPTPVYLEAHSDKMRFDEIFKSEPLQSSFLRKWLKSDFRIKSFRTFKEFKEGFGLRPLVGLAGLLVLFTMGIFYFSAPFSLENDLQNPVEIGGDPDISEDNEQAEVAAERAESTENEKVLNDPSVPSVKDEFEATPSLIASAPEEADIENITEKPVEIGPSSQDKTEGYDGGQEKEDPKVEETKTEPTPADGIDQFEPMPPAESQGVVKIEKAIVKRMLDQQDVAGELPMEPRKIILDVSSGSASLTGDGLRTLLNFIENLEQYPNTRLLVKGFVSAKSNTPENIKISKERALNVQKLLEEKGIDAKRIEVVGMGNQEPIASNDTAEGRSKNRRVEVSIIDDGIRE
jgi:general secretion pathway protein A